MKNNLDLVKYCKAKLNIKTVYVLGAFGQKLTESFLDQKAKQYEFNEVNRSMIKKHYGAQAFDCCGLIKAFLWGDNPLNYKGSEDENEAMMLNRAKKKGKINTLPETPGILVFLPGHVGVYIGNEEVIECTPSPTLGGWGVIKTKLSQRKWTNWAEYARIEYKKDKPPKSVKYWVETKYFKLDKKGRVLNKEVDKVRKIFEKYKVDYYNQVKKNKIKINGRSCYKVTADKIAADLKEIKMLNKVHKL